ncbi:MAG: biotin--[acetyl-CoA-carboxylase] ligase [bacterium]
MAIQSTMLINPEEIKANLKTKFIGKRIIYYDSIDSTNLEAFRLIENFKAKHGDLILTKKQTTGRGQQSNEWHSPSGGLYLSIITVSKVTESLNFITFVSGISCQEAIKSVSGVEAGLKWVNDIIINNQKLGGILTESITRGKISTQVSGIGINVNSKVANTTNKFQPISLMELTGNQVNINLLIAEICNFFEKYFDIYQHNSSKIMEKWFEYADIIS